MLDLTGGFGCSQVPAKVTMDVAKNRNPNKSAQVKYCAGLVLSFMMKVGTRPQTAEPNVDQIMRTFENLALMV